jgi:hypothetical protein
MITLVVKSSFNRAVLSNGGFKYSSWVDLPFSSHARIVEAIDSMIL